MGRGPVWRDEDTANRTGGQDGGLSGPRQEERRAASAPPREWLPVNLDLQLSWLRLPHLPPQMRGLASASGCGFRVGMRLRLRTEQGRRAQCRLRGHRQDQRGHCPPTAGAPRCGVRSEGRQYSVFQERNLSGQKQGRGPNDWGGRRHRACWPDGAPFQRARSLVPMTDLGKALPPPSASAAPWGLQMAFPWRLMEIWQ